MKNDLIESILKDVLKHSHALYKEVLAAIEKELKRYHQPNPRRMRSVLTAIFNRYMPRQAQLLGDAVVAAVLAGNQAVLNLVGRTAAAPNAKMPPDVFDPFGFTRKRYPIIENAVRHLGGRRAVSAELFYRAKPEARRYALFTVKHLSQKSVAKVQQALTKTVDVSTSLPKFKEALAESFKTAPLGPARTEMVYRTGVSQAFSDGNFAAYENPYVAATMPYCRHWAIHDARVRPSHLLVERSGIQGTNWFRMDDPITRLLQIPLSFNCRCGVTFHSIRQAATAGIEEAVKWLRTGTDPKEAYVKMPNFAPNQMPEFVADRLRSRNARKTIQMALDDEWYVLDHEAPESNIERLVESCTYVYM